MLTRLAYLEAILLVLIRLCDAGLSHRHQRKAMRTSPAAARR